MENDNVTDVSKKIKVEMNDDGDDSNADPEDEIKKNNAIKVKDYKTLNFG